MRTKSRIGFNLDAIIAEKIFKPLGKRANLKDTLQVVELYTDTKEYHQLISQLTDLGVSIIESKYEVYSKEEISSAPLLQVVPNSYCGYPQPDKNFGYLLTSFDSYKGCKECSFGRLQLKPLRLSRPKIGKNDIVGVWWTRELIITASLKELLESEKITGIEIWPVIDHKKNIEFTDVFQLHITCELPNMSSDTKITMDDKDICECGHGETLLEGEVIFNRNSILKSLDFNLTKEWFGSCMGMWRWPFASQKVYRLFTENNIKGVRFVPAKIID